MSPCRYIGTSYKRILPYVRTTIKHTFRTWKKSNDVLEILLADAGGNKFQYRVAKIDILHLTEIWVSSSNGWNLTLFICMVGGVARVIVHCMLRKNELWSKTLLENVLKINGYIPKRIVGGSLLHMELSVWLRRKDHCEYQTSYPRNCYRLRLRSKNEVPTWPNSCRYDWYDFWKPYRPGTCRKQGQPYCVALQMWLRKWSGSYYAWFTCRVQEKLWLQISQCFVLPRSDREATRLFDRNKKDR